MQLQARGTGRTTRMLKEAVRLAEEGRAVYIVSATHYQAGSLKSFVGKEEADALGIKFECLDSLPNFDFVKMTAPDAHANCEFLFDHYAIEYKFWPLLQMYHRFDERK